MKTITSAAGAQRLFALSIIARLPLAALSIAMLVHAQHLTGSLSAAGVVTGVYAVSLGIGGPVLGQLVDRCGQTVVLLASAAGAAALLEALAILPVGASPALIVALAAGTGLLTPPIGACLRTLFPAILPNGDAVRAAYSVDATASELTWVCGPPLALALGALCSTGAALAAGGIVLVVATAAFAAQPASRGWAPVAAPRPRGGSLATPAMRTLVIVFIAVGVLFGAAEVAVTAAAEALGSKSIAGPLLGLWGAGSLAGGVMASRLARRARGGVSLTRILAVLTAGHLLLAVLAGNAYALAVGLFIAGSAIAPSYAAIYAIVDRVAPDGTLTEAFTWMSTAVAIGGAIGAATAGPVAAAFGPTAAFLLAGGAGALAVTFATAGGRTRSPASPPAAIRANAPEASAVAPACVAAPVATIATITS